MGFNKLDIIIYILLILLTLGNFILIIILNVNIPDKIPENKVDDISLSSLFSFNFINIESTPVYTENNTNLGLTGRLILNCYTGICPTIDFSYDIDENAKYHYRDEYDYVCSEQCSHNGKDECICDDADQNIGSCSRKYDDKYERGKYCVAENVIYNWKGKRFNILKELQFSYYKNVMLKEEECPKGTIICGIVDDNENKLCLSSNLNCPINYISENKINNNKLHSSIVIGNKTFYYGFDDDTANKRKIIAGLMADTDLFLNEDNNETVIIDTDTISGFLSYNKNLYKQVDLGFDPYQESNIDQRGNSYLKIFYNKKINLSEFRDNIETYNLNHEINKDLIEPMRKNSIYILNFGQISFAILLVVVIFVMEYEINFRGSLKINYTFTFIFFVGYIGTFIFVCINIHKFNKLKRLGSVDVKLPTMLNLLIFILLIVIFIYCIFFVIYLYFLREKCEYCSCNICCKKSQKNNTVSTTVKTKSNIENDNMHHEGQISTMNFNN